jgi:hypothetical protein
VHGEVEAAHHIGLLTGKVDAGIARISLKLIAGRQSICPEIIRGNAKRSKRNVIFEFM